MNNAHNRTKIEAIISRNRTTITLYLPYAAKSVKLTAGDEKTLIGLLDTITGLNATAGLIERIRHIQQLEYLGASQTGNTVTQKLAA